MLRVVLGSVPENIFISGACREEGGGVQTDGGAPNVTMFLMSLGPFYVE
jgi:hypothetical protein